jgi:hypothetical protein
MARVRASARSSELTGNPDFWRAMTRIADPLADRTVAAIVGRDAKLLQPGDAGMTRLGQATRLMAEWTTNGSLATWSPSMPGADDEVVAALRAYLDEGAKLPAWARPADILRAETAFMEYGPTSCTLLFCASLPECYVLPHLAQVLHAAGQLEAHTEHRIRQTAAMIFPVMMEGGLTTPEGGGIAQVLKVRLIHATIRHLILRGPVEEAHGPVAPLRAPGPNASLPQALLATGWDVEHQGLPCSQLELAYTLLTFGYVFLKGMRTFGLRLPREDEEATLHTWNVVGHVLGIQDALMFRTMDEAAAAFDGMQAMARAEAIVQDARPPLGRALAAAMARTIAIPVVRSVPVPLTRWLIGKRSADEIGLNQRVGLLTWVLFVAGRAAIGFADAVVRLALPRFSLTRMFTRVVGYHFLTRFLLDQTRPLALPDELLGPLQQTVASWQTDDKAPAWMNRLEDRMTAAGPWKPHA